MEIKRCAHCRFENTADQFYCRNCGKFLNSSTENRIKRATIWDSIPKPIVGGAVDSKFPTQNGDTDVDCQVVLCPQCGGEEQVINGVFPMACSNCGYFFQIGVDKIYKKGKFPGNNIPKETTISNPKVKVIKENTSCMRITLKSDSFVLPQNIAPSGDVMGKNGTIFKQLKIRSEIKFFRAPTGWYIEVLDGDCIVENVHVNTSVERQLKHGDMILVDNYLFFIEITE